MAEQRKKDKLTTIIPTTEELQPVSREIVIQNSRPKNVIPVQTKPTVEEVFVKSLNSFLGKNADFAIVNSDGKILKTLKRQSAFAEGHRINRSRGIDRILEIH